MLNNSIEQAQTAEKTKKKITYKEALRIARNEYARKYRENNREKLREYHRQWAKDNQDKVKEHQKRFWDNKARQIMQEYNGDDNE